MENISFDDIINYRKKFSGHIIDKCEIYDDMTKNNRDVLIIGLSGGGHTFKLIDELSRIKCIDKISLFVPYTNEEIIEKYRNIKIYYRLLDIPYNRNDCDVIVGDLSKWLDYREYLSLYDNVHYPIHDNSYDKTWITNNIESMYEVYNCVTANSCNDLAIYLINASSLNAKYFVQRGHEYSKYIHSYGYNIIRIIDKANTKGNVLYTGAGVYSYIDADCILSAIANCESMYAIEPSNNGIILLDVLSNTYKRIELIREYVSCDNKRIFIPNTPNLDYSPFDIINKTYYPKIDVRDISSYKAVKTTTIDNIVAEHKIKNISCIVYGDYNQYESMLGSKETILKYQPDIISTFGCDRFDFIDIISFLSKLGYSIEFSLTSPRQRAIFATMRNIL